MTHKLKGLWEVRSIGPTGKTKISEISRIEEVNVRKSIRLKALGKKHKGYSFNMNYNNYLTAPDKDIYYNFPFSYFYIHEAN